MEHPEYPDSRIRPLPDDQAVANEEFERAKAEYIERCAPLFKEALREMLEGRARTIDPSPEVQEMNDLYFKKLGLEADEFSEDEDEENL